MYKSWKDENGRWKNEWNVCVERDNTKAVVESRLCRWVVRRCRTKQESEKISRDPSDCVHECGIIEERK